MSDLPGMGSAGNPVRLDPFQRIIEVGWAGGGVVTVELEATFVTGFFMHVLQPEDIFIGTKNLTAIAPADYRDDPDWYVNKIGQPFIIEEHIVTEDELDDIWIWDAFLINALGDDTGVDAGNALYGTFDFHFTGQQIAYDTEHFGRPLLGDYVTHTHPNGHQVTYAKGATPLGTAFIMWQAPPSSGGTLYTGVVIRTSDPNGVPPVQDLSGTESWYWYHTRTQPGQETSRYRQAYLAYFKSDRTISVEYSNFGNVLQANTVKITLKGYPDGTSFTVHEGHITPDPPMDPTWQATETIQAATDVTRVFSASGVTPPP